jgi:hypothetical protein
VPLMGPYSARLMAACSDHCSGAAAARPTQLHGGWLGDRPDLKITTEICMLLPMVLPIMVIAMRRRRW